MKVCNIGDVRIVKMNVGQTAQRIRQKSGCDGTDSKWNHFEMLRVKNANYYFQG